MISVLFAGDHNLIRQILQRLLERMRIMQVVAVASNGQEAVEQAVLHYPNVAVMDVSMPCLNVIEATKQFCACCPKTPALLL
jgi:DNA-binding NarL/FixJ family response regulator